MNTFNRDKKFENNNINLIEYDLEEKNEIIYSNFNNKNIPISLKQYNSKKIFFINKMINKTNYFKRIVNNNYCIEPIDKCFLQIEWSIYNNITLEYKFQFQILY